MFNVNVIFRDLQSVHLWKDVGTIPLYYHRRGFGKCRLLGGAGPVVSKDYPVAEVPIVGFNFRSPVDLLFFSIFSLRNRNDVYLIYHLCWSSAMVIFFLRLIGVRKVFLKFDMNQFVAGRLALLDGTLRRLSPKAWLRRVAYRQLSGGIVETNAVYEILKKIPELRGRLTVVPNGGFSLSSRSSTLPAKENILIFAGRLGSIPKNTAGILAALRRVRSLKGWKMIFAGPVVDPVFERELACLRQARPDLSSYIETVGNLDQTALYSLFARGKFLVAPSLWEGSSISVVEALSYGMNLIATDAGIVEDLLTTTPMPTVIRGQSVFYHSLLSSMAETGDVSLPDESAMFAAFRACGREEEVIGGLASIFDRVIDGDIIYSPYPEHLTSTFSHEAVADRLHDLVVQSDRAELNKSCSKNAL